MLVDVVLQRPDIAIRRLVLEPGEAMPWHIDPCRRFSIVVRGEQLTIEDHATRQLHVIPVQPGLAGWDEPTAEGHRAINTGATAYEEFVIFLIEPAGIEFQPTAR